MAELSDRKQKVLRALVYEYIERAEPIASENLVRNYDFGVRSATLRNELSEMAEMGYLEQPHASAGRIPSDIGYRYYVDHLLVAGTIAPRRKKQLTDATREQDALRDLLLHSTKLLSRFTSLLSAAATIRDSGLNVRNVVLTPLSPGQAMLVVVFNNGHIENRVVDFERQVADEQINAVGQRLQGWLAGREAQALATLEAPETSEPADELLPHTLESLRSIGSKWSRGLLVIEGEEYVLAQPEFQRNPRLIREMLDKLEDEETMHRILLSPREKQQITIGSEHEDEGMHAFTVIREPFFIGERLVGSLAIVGPTRMDYARAIRLLEFTAGAVGSTLHRWLK